MSVNAFKQVKAHFVKLGGRAVAHDKWGTAFEFPDGQRMYVRADLRGPQVRRYVEESNARYGAPVHVWEPARRRPGHPKLDLDSCVASEHAKDRLRLMQSQGQVSFTDLLHTLRLPNRVGWSDAHGSWVWIGDLVALPLTFRPDGSAVIKTVLWASEELWESHSRPEKSPVREHRA